MNALQKGFSFALVAFVAVVMTVVLTSTAHADDYFGDCCGGGFDSSFNGGYDSSYDGFDSSYNYGYDSIYTPGYDSTYEPGYDSYYEPGYDSYYEPGYDSYYTPGYDSSYSPGYGSSYSESPIFYGSDGAMYSSTGGGYTTGGGYPFSFGTYEIGRPTGGPRTTTVSTPSSQHQNQSQSSTNVNENINNTTSNAVVSNSGNSNNVNNVNVVVNVPQQQAQVTPVYQLPVLQYPIQYVQPIQPVQPAPYCTISISNSGYGYNSSQATLTWSSTNASSAYISPNVGSVSTYGTRVVYPGVSQTYTMTVYGYNGQTATCQTFYTYTPTYIAPTTPYVSLSQIPYTGFDLGTVGTSIYWASMIAFALAAGYLMVYFRGGAAALAGNMMGSRGYASEESEEVVATPVIAPVVAVPAEEELSTGMSFNLPVTSSRHVTTDTMSVTPDGRLVISRN